MLSAVLFESVLSLAVTLDCRFNSKCVGKCVEVIGLHSFPFVYFDTSILNLSYVITIAVSFGSCIFARYFLSSRNFPSGPKFSVKMSTAFCICNAGCL